MIKTLGISIVDASLTPQVVTVGSPYIVTADVRENQYGLATHVHALVCTHSGDNIRIRMPPAYITHDMKMLVTYSNQRLRIRKEG